MPKHNLCPCPQCSGADCDSPMYEDGDGEPICCSCEDSWRSGCREAAQLALAVLHSGWKLTERQRRILTARTTDFDLEHIALELGMTHKRALKIEWPLLAKIEAHPEGLPKRAQRILAQRAWRQAAEERSVAIQVEGNVIRLERAAARRVSP